ncbi:MAG: hypothetical protein PF480_09275 [Roseovarius sp.]|jgi:hypothetical protein|nr:hypothetical protein [Roseovarius sp.]
MRTPNLATVAAFALLTGCAAYAAPPEPKPAMQSHAMPMADHSAHQQMMERAQNAKTPAEREKLMNENMAMMKAHMASMKAKMADGGMMSRGDKPMAMDPAHMEKMKQHMGMMHQMMESLIMQQELMMPPKK